MKIDKDKIINQIDMNWTQDEIIKFVHIELGKQLIYDNSYSDNKQDKNNEKSEMTKMSKVRRSNLLHGNTTLENTEQVCKGMAEISAAIFNELGMEAQVIGVEEKGDVDGTIKEESRETVVVPEIYSVYFDGNNIVASENEQTKQTNTTAKHYYTEIYINGEPSIIQDYLIEKALARIKMGESTIQDNIIPGLCTEDDYKKRNDSLTQIKDSFKDKLKHELEQKYGDGINLDNKIELIFEKLQQENFEFGFEEMNDSFIFLLRNITNSEEQIQIKNGLEHSNLIRESESKADVVRIYKINGKDYLVRGNIDRLEELPSIGILNEENIDEILRSGFEPRGKRDKEFLEKYNKKEDNNYKRNEVDKMAYFHDQKSDQHFENMKMGNYVITKEKIGKATINASIEAKKKADRVENINTKDKINEGESIDDN